ncbi:MAG TPA: hypothetical protein PLE54_11985 [Burkholderiaceae bacterium]|nr:hypothetical protein [Burkholderiaceae bacterium]
MGAQFNPSTQAVPAARNGPSAALALCCGLAYAYGLSIAAQSLVTMNPSRATPGAIRVLSIPPLEPHPLELKSVMTAKPLVSLPLEMLSPPQFDLDELPLPQTQWLAVTQSADTVASGPPAPAVAGNPDTMLAQAPAGTLQDSRPTVSDAEPTSGEDPRVPGGATLVAAVLIDADGRAVTVRIVAPSDRPDEDQKYVAAVTGSLLGKPTPPLAPGETRWLEFRVRHDAGDNIIASE